jgi:hypothetical protein
MAKGSSKPSHFALFNAAHEAPKTIRASKIYSLWVEVLGRPIKKLDDAPDDYNIPDVQAYADYLNKTKQFKPLGLDLQPADVAGADTMGKIGAAIVLNFQQRHWIVTPD